MAGSGGFIYDNKVKFKRHSKSVTSEEKYLQDKDWLSMVVFACLFSWIIFTVILAQTLAWLTDQVLQASGYNWPSIIWLVVSLVQGILILIPSSFLAWLWPNQRYRLIYRIWAASVVITIVYAPIRLVNLPAVLTANILQILISLFLIIVTVGYLLLSQQPIPSLRFSRSSMLGLSLVGLVVYSWFAWGALGSILDTAFNLLAGLLFGLFSGLFLAYFLYQPLHDSSHNRVANIVLGGMASGAVMLMLSSAFGFGGLQLVLILMIPALSWSATMLFEWFDPEFSARQKWLPATILVGTATAIPMMMIDPDELSLELAFNSRDQLSWSFYAALVSMFTALGLALILALIRRRVRVRRSAWLIALTTGSVWMGAILVYFFVGQPGFFGDQLLVVLENQADPSAYQEIRDFNARRQFVYDVLREHANVDQQGLRRDLDRLGINYTPYYLVNALAVDAGPLVKIWLETRPEVDRVLDNPVLRPLPVLPDKRTGSANAPAEIPWNLTLIGADRVWEDFGVTGDGIIIGQSDSGVQGDHPELVDSYRGRDGDNDFNWFDPWNHSAEPTDITGHGTHTLGLIAGKNTGVAPDAEWFGCTNLARNLANPSLYLDCMQFMLAPFPMDGDPFVDGDPALSAHVINNSWGCPEQEGCDSGALVDAVRAMRAAGIFVVAAAGNDGPACETVQDPLALYEEVFSVGAIDQGGNLASFSSRGPVTADGSGRTKPDIVAPGVDVLSSFPNNSYEYLPGTSMAGPHVAGVVALMWSANPSLIGDVERTEEILRHTAKPYDGSLPSCVSNQDIPNNGVGYGIVDAYAAVKMALEE